MITPLRATAVLAAASAVSVIAGMATAKAYALLVGPAGYGLYALLQSALSLSALVAGLGVGVMLVRVLAANEAVGDAQGVAAARTAARGLALVGAVGGGCALAFFSGSLGNALGTNPVDLVLLAPALICNVGAGVEISILNGHRRIQALAAATAASAAAVSITSVISVVAMGVEGIALGLLFGSVAAYFIAVLSVRLSDPLAGVPARRPDVMASARSLLATGLPYTASAICGTGALLTTPLIVGIAAGNSEVGYYRAASAISVAYLGFLVRAMSQDYYPRVSAAFQHPQTLPRVITSQLKLVIWLATPIILTSLAASDVLVTLLYSPDFHPAADVLHWQLAGDFLKLPAWTLSFVVLASGRSMAYLGLELIGGVSLIASTVIGVMTLGLVGAGAAYFVTYAIYYPVALWFVHRGTSLRLGPTYWVPFGLAGIVAMITAAGDLMAAPWLFPIGYGGLAISAIAAAAVYFLRRRSLGRSTQLAMEEE
jgi:PST family polysaccharide transporter